MQSELDAISSQVLDLESRLASKEWRLNNLYFILTKKAEFLPLSFNEVQKDYFNNYLAKQNSRESLRAGGKVKKSYILKARQQGFSTMCLIDCLDETIFNKNTTVAIVAHEEKSVTKLFEIVKRAYEMLPNDPRIKPRVSIDNRNELYFPDLNSKIFVTLDARSGTVHKLHISELAFIKNTRKMVAGTLAAVAPGGSVTFETTANGVGNYAYEEWTDEDNDIEKFFYNWTWTKEYREETDLTLDELQAEYRPLALQYKLKEDPYTEFNLDKEQFAFYISRAREYRELVKQEYPFDDLEAFISSGLNVFDFNDIAKHYPIAPVEVKYQDLLVWEKPLVGNTYVIGVDSSEGLGQDNGVIEVLNATTGNQAAEFASPNVKPSELARLAVTIAKEYNGALIVPEINGASGGSLLESIKKDYQNIYRREVFDKRSRKMTKSIGWRTTPNTKQILVHSLEEALREEDVLINSEEALKEFRVFVRTEESKKSGYGAEQGKKDDRVIALGLALQGMKFMPAAVTPMTIAERKLKEYLKSQEIAKIVKETQNNTTETFKVNDFNKRRSGSRQNRGADVRDILSNL